MIRKLRWKFVGVCMVLVAVVLGGVFLAAYRAVDRNIEELSRQLLRRVLEESDGTGRQPNASIEIGGDRVLLPYFTVNIWGDTAYITGGTYADLENTEVLQDILQRCIDQDQQEGEIAAYRLRYLIQDMHLYRRVAFVDMSMEQAMLKGMVRSYLTIALMAMLALFGLSVLLARWATQPVERAWQQQRQFLSDASHELKTPLTVILANAELLSDSDLPEGQRRWSGSICAEARIMRSLVEQMLTLARADNGVAPAAQTAVSLTRAAEACALSFEPVAFEAGKSLEESIAPDLWVMGDGQRLRQIISILLDNAVKYGADGGVITLSLQRSDRHQVRLQVSNPGPPIPPAHLRRLFERFYRADASRGEQAGFGLGLAIAQTIAREHRGTLRAESDETSTRFILTLPLTKPPETPSGAIEQTLSPEKAPPPALPEGRETETGKAP